MQAVPVVVCGRCHARCNQCRAGALDQLRVTGDHSEIKQPDAGAELTPCDFGALAGVRTA